MARRRRIPFTRLRVMADYGSSGIWSCEEIGPFRHGMVRYATLHLPRDLKERFRAWIERYWQRKSDTFDTEAFNEEGLELAKELKRQVGSETNVMFAAEAPQGGLLPEVEIEDDDGQLNQDGSA